MDTDAKNGAAGMAGEPATFEQWCEFASQSATIHPGMATVLAFLRRDPQFFGADGNSPRDWSRLAKALDDARSGGEDAKLLEQDFLAALPALMTGKAGESLRAYVEAERAPAEIAEAILSGQRMEGAVKERFLAAFGDGYSANAQFFAYQFASILASGAARDIVAASKSGASIEDACRQFAHGAFCVNDDTFAFGIDCFKSLVRAGGGDALAEEVKKTAGAALGAEASARGVKKSASAAFGAELMGDVPARGSFRRRS